MLLRIVLPLVQLLLGAMQHIDNMKLRLKFFAVFLTLGILAFSPARGGPSLSINANCAVAFYGGGPKNMTEACEQNRGIVSSDTFKVGDSISLDTYVKTGIPVFANTAYEAHGDFGHLGIGVGTRVTAIDLGLGTGISADATVSASFTDYITLQSSSLARGTQVSVDLRYSIDGSGSASDNIANDSLGYGYSYGNGFVKLGGVNEYNVVPVYYSTFCEGISSEGLQPDCVRFGTFLGTFRLEEHKILTLGIGIPYQIDANYLVRSISLADLRPGTCPASDSCQATSSFDSSNSFLTYLTPLSNDFSIVSSSGHDYTFVVAADPSAAPEPASLALFGIGIVVIGVSKRKKRRLPA